MAFMVPVADHMVMYHVDTDSGIEYVPADLVGYVHPELAGSSDTKARFLEYVEVSDTDGIHEIERNEGWYARLSAPGYMDCTSWDGPHETAETALTAVKTMYDVDDDGETITN